MSIGNDVLDKDNVDQEKLLKEKLSVLIYYNNDTLGNICYRGDEYEIGEDKTYLRYIGTSTKPTQPIGLTNYSFMFEDRTDLECIDLSDWNMSEATVLLGMFKHCILLKDISSLADWDVSNVVLMVSMFDECYSLEDIKSLQKWNVINLYSTSFMFCKCTKLKDISPLGNWFSKFKYRKLFKRFSINNISYMFNECILLENILPLKNWDVRTISKFNNLFRGCDVLKDVSPLKEWKVSLFSNKDDMFTEVDHISHNRLIDSVNTYKNIDRSNKVLNKRIMKLYKRMFDNDKYLYYSVHDVYELLKYINNNNLVSFIPSYYISCLFKIIDYSIITGIEETNRNMKSIICNKYSPYINSMSSLQDLYYDEYFKFSSFVLYYKMYQFKDIISFTTDLWFNCGKSNNECSANLEKYYVNCKY